MSDSPLLTREVKQYLEQFRLEEVVTKAVNEVVRNRPRDAYTFLSGYFAKLSEEPPVIKEVRAREVLLENRPSLRITVICDVKGLMVPGPEITFSPESQDTYLLYYIFRDDNRHDGKGMTNAAARCITLFQSLRDLDIYQQRRIDNALERSCEDNISFQPVIYIQHGLNTIVSISLASVCAGAFHKQIPLYSHIYTLYSRKEWTSAPLPVLLVPVLHGGKQNVSKIKFAKFYIYEANPGTRTKEVVIHQIRGFYEGIRKIIAGGKHGEAGIKIVPSGGFIPPVDNFNDCLKILEDAASQSGVSLGNDFLVAIDCKADDFYISESNKYEYEGFKVPPDANQLSDIYLKLINDKSYIGILEDPIASTDTEGWKILSTKLAFSRIKLISTSPYRSSMRIINQTFDSEEDRKEEIKEERLKPAYISFKHTLPVTQLIDLKRIANKKEFGIILRESAYESNDSYLIDLAVGLCADFIVVGPPVKSSRIEKYNRYLEISETLNN